MLLFWSLAGLLVALTLGLLLWPLLRGGRIAPAPDAGAAAIAVYRDHKRSLDAEWASGALSAAEHDAALAELTRRVAAEAGEVPVAAAALPRRKRALAVALLLVVPGASIGLYLQLGNPQAVAVAAADGGHDLSESQVVAMVEGLAQRMKQHPEDADGWVLLARSYYTLQLFAEAADAYGHATELLPDDPNLLADYADVLAATHGKKLAGKPTALVERALAIDPKHRKALTLAATGAMEAGDADRSIVYWRRLTADLPPDSDQAREVADVIAEIEAADRARKVPVQAVSSTRASRAADTSPEKVAPIATAKLAAGSIRGRVSLSPALAAKVVPTDTVFIFAHAVAGPRMPLALLRIPASKLPNDFSLDDSTGMLPGVKLSEAATVVVEARISRSGNALPQTGDLFGRTEAVKPGTSGVHVTIEQIVP